MNNRLYLSLILLIICTIALQVNSVFGRIVTGQDGKPLPPGTYNKTGTIDSCQWDKSRCMISDQTIALANDIKLFLSDNTTAGTADFPEGTKVRFYLFKGKITAMWQLDKPKQGRVKGHGTVLDKVRHE